VYKLDIIAKNFSLYVKRRFDHIRSSSVNYNINKQLQGQYKIKVKVIVANY